MAYAASFAGSLASCRRVGCPVAQSGQRQIMGVRALPEVRGGGGPGRTGRYSSITVFFTASDPANTVRIRTGSAPVFVPL